MSSSAFKIDGRYEGIVRSHTGPVAEAVIVGWKRPFWGDDIDSIWPLLEEDVRRVAVACMNAGDNVSPLAQLNPDGTFASNDNRMRALLLNTMRAFFGASTMEDAETVFMDSFRSGLPRNPASPTPDPVIVKMIEPTPGGPSPCYTCKQNFATFAQVMAHKVLAHDYLSPKYTMAWAIDVAQQVANGSSGPSTTAGPLNKPLDPPAPDDSGLKLVTEAWVPTLKFNLSSLGLEIKPRQFGYFAVDDDDEPARFYYIRRLDKAASLRARFVWSKFVYRKEYLSRGDYVIRKEAGDTKKWVGIQREPKATRDERPFEGIYIGEYEDDLAKIVSAPLDARMLYGKLIGACGFCGRKLTDAESRARGIGPDCYEHKYFDQKFAQRVAVTP